MTRAGSVMIAVAALLMAAPAADAAGNWTIGVNGGVTSPTGDFLKDFKVGPVAGIDICMHINDRFAVGAEGSWTQNGHKDVGVVEDLGGGDTHTLNEDKLKNISGGVLGKYIFPVGESKIAPYGLVGLGFYNVKEDYRETFVLGGTTLVFTDESDGVRAETRFGGKLGAGAVYQVTPTVGISLQAEYNIVTVDTSGAPAGTPSTFKYLGFRAGLNYHVMKY